MTEITEPYREWPELMCVLCGLIVVMNDEGSVNSYPSKCVGNGGGEHIHPRSPAAQAARELHQAWLRDPMATVA